MLYNSLKSLINDTQPRSKAVTANLGDPTGKIKVDGRANYVYVTTQNGQTWQVYNTKVSVSKWWIPVLVGYAPENIHKQQVLGVDYQNPISENVQIPSVPPHGDTHSYPNADTTWIARQQYLPLKVSPVGDMEVFIYPSVEYFTGTYSVISATGTYDLSSYIPSGDYGSLGAYVLIYIDESNTILFHKGEEVNLYELSLSDIPTPTGSINYNPLAAVRVWSGQEQLIESRIDTDIIDLRLSNNFINQSVSTSSDINLVTGTFDYIDYNTLYSGTNDVIGRTSWNEDKWTLNVGLPNGSLLQVGQEQYYPPVKNQTGADIPNGRFVMYAGTLEASGRIKIQRAVTDGTYSASRMMGLTTHDIANGDDGLVAWFGEVRGLVTDGSEQGETWSNEDLLYPDPNNDGELTNIEPSAPNLNIPVAVVVYASASNGVLFVRPQLRMKLGELHDVNGTTPNDRAPLMWSASGSYWDVDNDARILTSGQYADFITLTTGTANADHLHLHSGSHISLDSTEFVGNLDGSVENVQALAEAVDGLDILPSADGVLGGKLDTSGYNLLGKAFSLSDDGVEVFTPAASAGLLFFNGGSGATVLRYAILMYRIGASPYISFIVNHADIEGTTGVLTGTTGTDGKFTISAGSSSLYFENRRGSVASPIINLF